MSLRRLLAASLAIATCALGAPSTAQYPSVLQLLDRYADGEFAAVVELLHGDADYGGILTQLRRDGPVWIEAGGGAGLFRLEE